MALIELKKIYKIYKMGSIEVTALKNISLQIKEKEFTSILGPSGSGKSTLLHIMGLLDRPTKGKIFFEGEDVSELDGNTQAEIRGKKIGFVFQTFNLIPHLTALENVYLPLTIQGIEKSEREEKGAEILEKLGLGDRLSHKPSELSGGQRQRVAIARALITNPKIILADEPTGNLDSKTGHEILEIFKNLNREGKTIVIITHDQYIAKQSKRIIKIKDGVIE